MIDFDNISRRSLDAEMPPRLMGCFIFGSSSKTRTNITTNTTSDTDNLSDIDGQAFNQIEGGVNILDGGAVRDSLDFAGEAVEGNERVTESALGFGRNSLDFGRGALSDVLDFGRSTITEQGAQNAAALSTFAALQGADIGENTRRVLQIAMIAAGVAAIWLITRRL